MQAQPLAARPYEEGKDSTLLASGENAGTLLAPGRKVPSLPPTVLASGHNDRAQAPGQNAGMLLAPSLPPIVALVGLPTDTALDIDNSRLPKRKRGSLRNSLHESFIQHVGPSLARSQETATRLAKQAAKYAQVRERTIFPRKCCSIQLLTCPVPSLPSSLHQSTAYGGPDVCHLVGWYPTWWPTIIPDFEPCRREDADERRTDRHQLDSTQH